MYGIFTSARPPKNETLIDCSKTYQHHGAYGKLVGEKERSDQRVQLKCKEQNAEPTP